MEKKEEFRPMANMPDALVDLVPSIVKLVREYKFKFTKVTLPRDGTNIVNYIRNSENVMKSKVIEFTSDQSNYYWIAYTSSSVIVYTFAKDRALEVEYEFLISNIEELIGEVDTRYVAR